MPASWCRKSPSCIVCQVDIREAVEEAQAALKANPNDLDARRVLARIYTQQIGDAQTNHVDENMARKAVEQYKLITDKDPSDTDSR